MQFRHVCEIERAVRQRELDERTMQALQEREERLEALRRKVHTHAQWNLSIVDTSTSTTGPRKCVLIREVSILLFQRLICTQKVYYWDLRN